MTEGEIAKRSPLEAVLGIVTEVQPGEGVSALLMTINVFLLLTAYYVIKPVREALILEQEGGANAKSYLGGAIAVALLIAVPAYARFAQRLPRNKLVVGVTLFFVSHVLLFYGGSLVPSLRGYLGVAFFIWVGIFNMMVVAQFWAFANDIYKEEQGKRLFALVGLGASSGAAAGSQVTKMLIGPLGTYNLLLVAAAILGVCAFLTQMVHVRESKRADAAPKESKEENPTADKKAENGAFGLVLRHRYLRYIAIFSLLFTFVNTNGEYLLGKLLKEDAVGRAKQQVGEREISAFLAGKHADAELKAWWDDEGSAKFPGRTLQSAKHDVAKAVVIKEHTRDLVGASYSDFFLWVNLLGVLLQTFLVSRIVKHLGLKRAFLIFPALALLSASALAVFPLLLTVRIGKTAENATDYSLNNTLRNMLWLPTTREMKYQAKQAVDTFCVRMGDVSSALLVFGAAEMLGMGVRGFALVNVGLVAAWIFCALRIVAENERMHGDAHG